MSETKVVQDNGNIPAVRVSYYQDNKKPELKLESGQRVSLLRYKTDKETKTLRSSMAVILNQVTKHAVIQQTERGAEMLQAMIDERQDELAKRCADKEFEFANVESAEFMVKDYFDNTRTAGGKRVSAEMIGKFFDESMQNWLMDRVISKFPAFDADKVAKVVSQYRTSFADLTKYSLPHSKQVSEMLAKAWGEFTTQESYEDSELGDWIGERIKKLQDRHNAQEMLVDAI